MYKVEVEEIESKLNSIRKHKKDFLFLSLLFCGLIALGFAWAGSADDMLLMLLFSFSFVHAFALYYYILPLLGKIDLLEQDIKNLKAATNVEDKRLY
ncbi:hypothetical protein [Ferrimonas lipolytica]|uniref:Uncharacterized protein n=1 Tax=Ferrimonas lipolytica TaxID=2724191 RepID=A0A6H1UBR3_9GAMM|nr:hypothetical protein [Ferrimonas lipolytica]QIZ76527.1 hypothetical protein HER31_06425 [Ferrimonas lipolytica]